MPNRTAGSASVVQDNWRMMIRVVQIPHSVKNTVGRFVHQAGVYVTQKHAVIYSLAKGKLCDSFTEYRALGLRFEMHASPYR